MTLLTYLCARMIWWKIITILKKNLNELIFMGKNLSALKIDLSILTLDRLLYPVKNFHCREMAPSKNYQMLLKSSVMISWMKSYNLPSNPYKKIK